MGEVVESGKDEWANRQEQILPDLDGIQVENGQIKAKAKPGQTGLSTI